MTRKKNGERARALIREYYAKEGPKGVLARLKKEKIEMSRGGLINVASDLGVKFENDPRHETRGKEIREAIKLHYESGGTKAVIDHLAEAGMEPLPSRGTISNIAGEMRIKREKGVPEPDLVEIEWPDPPVLHITPEAWNKNSVAVGGCSRISWCDKGARVYLTELGFKCFAEEGCRYVVIVGGLLASSYVGIRIKERLKALTAQQRKLYGESVTDNVCQDIATELTSIIPRIMKPKMAVTDDGSPFVKIYIMPSPVLDGRYAEQVFYHLQQKRDDIVIYKSGGSPTRLKGVGATEEEKQAGRMIHWLTIRKTRMPNKSASGPNDKEIGEEAMGAKRFSPDLYAVGGYGSSYAKPGDGEQAVARFAVPCLSVPMPRRPGEPSMALNQIGVEIIDVLPSGEWSAKTVSFRDVVFRERELFVTSIQAGATKLQQRIVDELKSPAEPDGLSVGELSDPDRLGLPRDKIEAALEGLTTEDPSPRATWPGLYRDESYRYNFHLAWFQNKRGVAWPYADGLQKLTRLMFGCLHAGYTTTDYEFVRWELPKIILEQNVQALELIGDIIAGLKHHMMHKGQVLSNMNYTDQETFAAELLATVVYDVFVARFSEKLKAKTKSVITCPQVAEAVTDALLMFIYIVGNHDGWQKETGHTPGVTFRDKLIATLYRAIGAYLRSQNLLLAGFDLETIIRSRMVELPEQEARHVFSCCGLTTALNHPSKGRTATTSTRAEEAAEFNRGVPLVDTANYHTAIAVNRWEPEVGQRLIIQAGAMVLWTQFENGLLKRVDFGPVLAKTGSKDGRIITSEVRFFSKPRIKKPYPQTTDPNQLKSDLKLLIAL
jgi:hypothetical protein